MCGGQKTTWGSLGFSFSAMWALGMELGSLGLAVGTFTHWALLLAPFVNFCSFGNWTQVPLWASQAFPTYHSLDVSFLFKFLRQGLTVLSRLALTYWSSNFQLLGWQACPTTRVIWEIFKYFLKGLFNFLLLCACVLYGYVCEWATQYACEIEGLWGVVSVLPLSPDLCGKHHYLSHLAPALFHPFKIPPGNAKISPLSMVCLQIVKPSITGVVFLSLSTQ